MSTPEQSVDDLLAEFNKEFGKKKKGGLPDPNAEAKRRNRAFHAANPPADKGAVSYAKAQLEKGAWRNYYDWQTHRMLLLEEAMREDTSGQLPELDWFPDARVTYVIQQRCACCHSVTEFVGSEYVRFHGRRRIFHELGGGSHQMQPVVLQRADKVDPNLLAFGLPDGDPLPDIVETMQETVRRCAGCIALERTALDLWVAATQPSVQDELPGFDEAMKEVK